MYLTCLESLSHTHGQSDFEEALEPLAPYIEEAGAGLHVLLGVH